MGTLNRVKYTGESFLNLEKQGWDRDTDIPYRNVLTGMWIVYEDTEQEAKND